jgi:hypothetical protein
MPSTHPVTNSTATMTMHITLVRHSTAVTGGRWCRVARRVFHPPMEKSRAQPKYKKSAKKSLPQPRKRSVRARHALAHLPLNIIPCSSVLCWMTALSSFIGSVTRSNLANFQLPELLLENSYSATLGITTNLSRPIPRWS